VIGGAPDYFFAPVAEQVGREAGRGFGAIAGGCAEVFTFEQLRELAGLVVPFLHAGIVEQFAQQVAIPPQAEVDGARRGADFLALAA
nr:hypothetical protein [Tanacetum cinerariifolium]